MSTKPATILFVCTGNTCRSPMAEGIARKLFAEAGEQVNVFSAGIMASEGSGATPEAIRAAQSMGIDIAAHRSLPLTPEMIAGADMIFALTNTHLQAILSKAPAAQGKAFTLDPAGQDIPDPIGFGQDVYDQTAQLIAAAIEQRAGLIVGKQ